MGTDPRQDAPCQNKTGNTTNGSTQLRVASPVFTGALNPCEPNPCGAAPCSVQDDVALCHGTFQTSESLLFCCSQFVRADSCFCGSPGLSSLSLSLPAARLSRVVFSSCCVARVCVSHGRLGVPVLVERGPARCHACRCICLQPSCRVWLVASARRLRRLLPCMLNCCSHPEPNTGSLLQPARFKSRILLLAE